MTGPGPLSGGRKSSPVGRSGIHPVLLSGAKSGGASAARVGRFSPPMARSPASMPLSSNDSDTAFAVCGMHISIPSSGATGLKIGLVGLGQRRDLVLKKIEIVLGANILGPFARHAPKPLYCGLRRREGARIINRDQDLDHLAAVDQLVALDHVELIGMGSAITVDESFGGECNRVDHQRVAALVMAHRFAIPGRLGVGGVRHIQK